jgi:hypothetical protein
MELIKQLVDEEYMLFNVSFQKEPVDEYGNRLSKWNELQYEDLVNHHNYKSLLWGMKMGKQKNGKKILSLDFDCCGKKDKEGNRMGCEITKEKLNEYLKNIDCEDGLYTSSTHGNMNVLIDYTNSKVLNDIINQISSNKTNFHELEILLGGNQVIPPSATISKKTLKTGNSRTFKNSNPFYVINDDECFIVDFIKNLLLPKITNNLNLMNTKQKPIHQEINTENIKDQIENDEYLKLLFDVIDNKRDINGAKIISHDMWFQICGILKFNGYSKNVWLNYSQKISLSKTASNLWEKIKNIRPMSIYGLQNIAKKVNMKEYREWFLKFKTIDFSERGIAEFYYRIEGKNLHYQDDIMYIYHENEWRIDKKGEIWNYKISHTLTDYLIDDLTYYNLFITELLKKDSLSEEEQTKIDKAGKMRKLIEGTIKQLKQNKFTNQIVNQLKNLIKAKIIKDVNFDVGIEQYYNIHFKNGCFDLKTKEFRERNYTDFITKFLDFDYKPKHEIPKIAIDTTNEFFLKLQPKEEQRNFTLGFLAYCITGDTSKQIFKTNIGYSASNGKSTELKIHHRVFDIYTTKLNGDTFTLGNSKKHKYVNICLHEPIRLAYIEELKQTKLDADGLKDWVDGEKITNEIMYDTCESKKIQAKLMTCSNKDMTIDSDKGILRRGKIQFYESQFLDDVSDDWGKNIFKKQSNFESKFDDEDYKNAYFHLLTNYIGKLEVPKEATEKFKEMAEEGDTMKTRFFDCFEITKQIEDRENKEFIMDTMGKGYDKKWNEILSMLKGLGLTYSRDKSKNGVKGVVMGIKLLMIKEENQIC